jgi:hypothetical protein
MNDFEWTYDIKEPTYITDLVRGDMYIITDISGQAELDYYNDTTMSGRYNIYSHIFVIDDGNFDVCSEAGFRDDLSGVDLDTCGYVDIWLEVLGSNGLEEADGCWVDMSTVKVQKI